MQWIDNKSAKLPIKSWSEIIEADAMKQAINLANHPVVYKHVALMPDCHVGFGMPIGGVIACIDALIPNAVGVDIGCGMSSVKTNIAVNDLDKKAIRDILNDLKRYLPLGEGHAHRERQSWTVLDNYEKMHRRLPGGVSNS